MIKDSTITDMMDVFFNGRPAPNARDHAEALRLLKGMHDRFHCEECICVVAKFLDRQLPNATKTKAKR